MSGFHALESAGLAGDPASPVHRLDARAKLLGLAGLTLVAATSPAGAWPLLAGCAVLLGAVALGARVPARVVWRRARVVLPLVLLAAASVPFLRQGGDVHRLGPLSVHDAGLTVFGAAAAKAAVGTLSAVLLAATTTVTAALEGLRRLRAPGRCSSRSPASRGATCSSSASELARMRTALAARGHRPRHLLQAAAIGQARHRAVPARARARRAGPRRDGRARLDRRAGRARRPGRSGRADLLFVAALAGLPLALRLGLELGA